MSSVVAAHPPSQPSQPEPGTTLVSAQSKQVKNGLDRLSAGTKQRVRAVGRWLVGLPEGRQVMDLQGQ